MNAFLHFIVNNAISRHFWVVYIISQFQFLRRLCSVLCKLHMYVHQKLGLWRPSFLVKWYRILSLLMNRLVLIKPTKIRIQLVYFQGFCEYFVFLTTGIVQWINWEYFFYFSIYKLDTFNPSNVQDVEEDWPLQIKDHAGVVHSVLLKPGEMVWYESARLVHARMKPLKGRSFENIFVHYMPRSLAWYSEDFR
jgi:hypothetical protein